MSCSIDIIITISFSHLLINIFDYSNNPFHSLIHSPIKDVLLVQISASDRKKERATGRNRHKEQQKQRKAKDIYQEVS